jgi:MEDS: MEthanogen/methylotroph, DcmR Sensory domain/Histidine kinase-like ATPase domain
MAAQTRQSILGGGEHVVQFYEHDGDLARAVGDYLTRSVLDGALAVVIASQAHRRQFEAMMAASGVDAERARHDDLVVWHDARATLEQFVREGRVDPAGFRRVVGGLIRQLAQSGRELRAYGEMVALLWDDGNVLGAIELEKLWNALAEELHFSLWCAYHTSSVAGEKHAGALHEVCRLHSAVVEDPRARFRAGPDAPFAARRFVAGLLACRPFAGRVAADDVQLVVSELTTNAVIHAGTPFSISVGCDGSAIRISVQDWSSMPPILRDGPPAARSGRGLRLVAAVARDWGVEPGPDGKTVWAELPLS